METQTKEQVANQIINELAQSACKPEVRTVVIELTEDADLDEDTGSYVLRGEGINGEAHVYFINKKYFQMGGSKLQNACVAGNTISMRVEDRIEGVTTFNKDSVDYYHSKSSTTFAGGLRKAGNLSLAKARRDAFKEDMEDSSIDPALATAYAMLYK